MRVRYTRGRTHRITNRAEVEAAHAAGKDRPKVQTDVGFYVVFYTQPWWCYWRARAYHQWTRATWRPLRALEKPLERHHNKHCKGDCTIGYTEPDKTSPEVKFCGYMPLTHRQDLRCDDLARKGYKTLGAPVTIDKAMYDALRPKHTDLTEYA